MIDNFTAWAAVARHHLRKIENARKWFGDDERAVFEHNGVKRTLKNKYDLALEREMPYVEKAVVEMEKIISGK